MGRIYVEEEEGEEHARISHVTSDYPLTNDDQIVLADATTAPLTLTLPYAVLNPGKLIRIVKTDSSGHAVTVACSGSDSVEGSATKSLGYQYSKLVCFSDGSSQWLIMIST